MGLVLCALQPVPSATCFLANSLPLAFVPLSSVSAQSRR